MNDLQTYKRNMKAKKVAQKNKPETTDIITSLNDNISYVGSNIYQGFIFGIGSGLGHVCMFLFLYIFVSYTFFQEQYPKY